MHTSERNGEASPKEQFQRFASLMRNTIRAYEEVLASRPFPIPLGMIHEEDGSQCEIRFPKHPAKHGQVYFFTVNAADGAEFSCVAKQNLPDLQRYQDLVDDVGHPLAAVPEIYGVAGSYFFMERLYGIEYDTLRAKLKEDEYFLAEYAKHTAELIIESAKQDLFFIDAVFSRGHNVIVDPVTARPRFAEISIPVRRDADLQSRTDSVLWQVMRAERISTANEDPRVKSRFIFALLKNLQTVLPPERWITRKKIVMPDHPRYQSIIADYAEQAIEPRFNQHVTLHGECGVYPIDDNYRSTEIISPRAIKAIQEDDPETFADLYLNDGFIDLISDPLDPDFAEIFGSRDQNEVTQLRLSIEACSTKLDKLACNLPAGIVQNYREMPVTVDQLRKLLSIFADLSKSDDIRHLAIAHTAETDTAQAMIQLHGLYKALKENTDEQTKQHILYNTQLALKKVHAVLED